MLFNSYEFVFAFFPLVLAGYYICTKSVRGFGGEKPEMLFLLAASLLFYAFSRPGYLPVLLISIAVNYVISRQMGRRTGRKQLLAAGLIFNLGLLFIFKYTDTGGFVPLGISFFTFTQIAFLTECYRGNVGKVSALSYGLYVSFFPKIMQGPIALPGEMLPQFEGSGPQAELYGRPKEPLQARQRRAVSWEGMYRGLYLFVLGLSKKVLIADTLGRAVDFGYTNMTVLNSGDALIVMLSYTLQLYFDFSGYCDMAMGIARMLGLELPLNFDSPYKAANIMEFWDRWHISLTGFFTRYLYIPLGGNRKGRLRTYGNCLLVFLVSGIWHGAGLTFVVWGMLHGLLFVGTRVFKDFRTKQKSNKVTRVICVFLTFLYVNLAWIFFRAPSLGNALEMIRRIFHFSFGRINRELAGCFNLDEFWYVIKVLGLDRWQYAHYILMTVLLGAVLAMVFFGKTAVRLAEKARPGVLSTVLLTVLFVWSVLSFSEVSSFLYVNF